MLINKFKKIVIKIGSSSIIDEKTGKVKIKWLNTLCKDIELLANENIKIGVNMSFRYWTPLDINETSPNIFNKIIDTVATGVERQILSNVPKVLRRL